MGGYNNEFPHTRMWDSDLREILEIFNRVNGLPLEFEEFRNQMNNDWENLKTFVNTYFENLDVQENINNKIDVLIADGTFERILRNEFNRYTSGINARMSSVEARMDSLTAMEAGSTTGDAELIDARVAANGKVWSNVGSHVRNVENEVDALYNYHDMEWRDGFYNLTDGVWHENTGQFQTSRALPFNYIPNFILGWKDWKRSINNTCSLWLGDVYKGYFSSSDNSIRDKGGVVNYNLEFDTIYIMIWSTVDPSTLMLATPLDYCRSKWYGANINVLGDSLTYGAGLTNIAAQRFSYILSMYTRATVNNYGVNSSLVSEHPEDTVDSFVERVTTMPNADLNIIFGGTNDYWTHKTRIGEITDTDITTFCGALNTIFSYLQIHQPASEILYVFPMHQVYDNKDDSHDFGYGNFNEFRKKAIELCAYRGVPVLDLYATSGTDVCHSVAQQSFYTTDGVHLTEHGHKLVADKIYNMIR